MKKQRTTESFIEDSKKLHGENTYNYDKCIFVKVHEKVTLFCNIHNTYFEVRPSKHLSLNIKQGCQLCSYKKHRSETKLKDTNYFIHKAKSIHGNLYDYSKTIYTTAKDKITVYCNTCNTYFDQVASSHLSGAGCSICSHDRGMDKQRHSTKTFIEACRIIHEDALDYTQTSYGKNNKDKVIVTCTKCNTSGLITPTSLLSGSKPTCNCDNHHGFQDNKPGLVYYLSIDNGKAYKIGITNKSVKERFNNMDLSKITVLYEWFFNNGYEARAMESSILRKFSSYKYEGIPLLSSGNSELFYCNVLEDLSINAL